MVEPISFSSFSFSSSSSSEREREREREWQAKETSVLSESPELCEEQSVGLTITSTVGTVQDSGDRVGQADHRTKEESPPGLVR